MTKPLPAGCVKKQDKDGHLSYHTAPVGDTLPEHTKDMDHCRACDTEGTADTAQNALYASVGSRFKYKAGLYPCHGFSCINVGIYCKRMTEEQYVTFLEEDGRKGKNRTWIDYVSHREFKPRTTTP